MTTKRDESGKKGESPSVRRNRLGEARGEDGPEPEKSREGRDKISRHRDSGGGDPDAGIHDA